MLQSTLRRSLVAADPSPPVRLTPADAAGRIILFSPFFSPNALLRPGLKPDSSPGDDSGFPDRLESATPRTDGAIMR